jgi:hypothetical protein
MGRQFRVDCCQAPQRTAGELVQFSGSHPPRDVPAARARRSALWQEDRGTTRGRAVAGPVDRDNGDDVVSGHTVRAGGHVRADGRVLVQAVHVDLVYDHVLGRHVVA